MKFTAAKRQPAGYTARELRDAFGLFPTGVAIITARASNTERLGVTVSSFNSVSIDPPLVMFSVARSARSAAAWESVEQFAVNILSDRQSEISTRFARSLSDKWEGMDPQNGKVIDAPLIRDALASLECELWARHDGGDHIILIGKIVYMEKSTLACPRPLVFMQGKYRRIDDGPMSAVPFDLAHLLHGW